MTGMTGNKYSFNNFSPITSIPTAVSLTTHAGGSEDFMQTPQEALVQQTVAGILHLQVGKIFSLDQILEVHRCMEDDKAEKRIVVLA